MSYRWGSIEELRAALVGLLESRHSGLVTDLRLEADGDTIVLSGEVASEACRSDAKRLALAFDGVFKVRNKLVVAAFLEAASDPDMDDYFNSGPPVEQTNGHQDDHAVSKPSRRRNPIPKMEKWVGETLTAKAQVEVTRHPVIEVSGTPRPGEWVELIIDLSNVAIEKSTALSLGSFDADWDEIGISVQLIVPWSAKTVAIEATITLLPDGSSKAARFFCQASNDYEEGMPAQVDAIFLHGTRVCGHVVRDVAEGTKGASAQPKEAALSAPSVSQGGFGAVPDASGPSVSVSILRNGERGQSWVWKAFVPGGTADGAGSVDLEGEGKEFADNLLLTCPDLKPARFKRVMDGIGEHLWDIAPADFRAAYAGWRSSLGPSFAIQFVTDDPYVPWEMMKPRLTAARHLFLDHPVARWPLSRVGRRLDRFEGGNILSFVPRCEGHDELAFAVAEGEWICAQLGGLAMSANVETFLRVLDGEHDHPVGLLHFAGHGREHTGVSAGGIELEDGTVSVTEVHQQRVVLGQRDGTLMVLNACETSAGSRLLGMNVGWGAAIADRSFGGLIAPLWEVQDEAAFEIMKAALPPLLDGTAGLGEAVRRGRLTTSETSVAAFAYLAHGDVMARFPATP